MEKQIYNHIKQNLNILKSSETNSNICCKCKTRHEENGTKQNISNVEMMTLGTITGLPLRIRRANKNV